MDTLILSTRKSHKEFSELPHKFQRVVRLLLINDTYHFWLELKKSRDPVECREVPA